MGPPLILGVKGVSCPLAPDVAPAVWWLGVGSVMRRERPALAALTIAAGRFSALDSAHCVLEPVPGPVFALAAPKLPLSATWSILVGVSLLRPRESVAAKIM
jgi:hypothetical protein